MKTVVLSCTAVISLCFVGTMAIFWKKRRVHPIQGRDPIIVIMSQVLNIIIMVLMTAQGLGLLEKCDDGVGVEVELLLTTTLLSVYAARCWKLHVMAQAAGMKATIVIESHLQKDNLKPGVALDTCKDVTGKFGCFQIDYLNSSWISNRALLAVFVIFFAQSLVGFLLTELLSTKCGGAKSSQIFYLVFELALFTCLSLYLYTKLYRLDEGFYMKLELLCVGLGYVSLFSIGTYFKMHVDEKLATLFFVLICVNCFFWSILYPLSKQKSSAARLKALDAAAHDEDEPYAISPLRVYLKTSRNNMKAFRKFLQKEFSQENLMFWYEVEAYRYLEDEERPFKALKIFKNYLSQHASLEVNLSYGVRSELLDRLERLGVGDNIITPEETENMRLPTDLFDRAQTNIHDLMEEDSYHRFTMSHGFIKRNVRRRAKNDSARQFRTEIMTTGENKKKLPREEDIC